MAEVNTAVDVGLWDTVRALEERIMILKQMADLAEQAGNGADAEKLRSKARLAEVKCQPLRELVLDADFFEPG